MNGKNRQLLLVEPVDFLEKPIEILNYRLENRHKII